VIGSRRLGSTSISGMNSVTRGIIGAVGAIVIIGVITWFAANYAAKEQNAQGHMIVPPFHPSSHIPLLAITVYIIGLILTSAAGPIAERKRRWALPWQVATLVTAGVALGVLVALPERHLSE
jgi:hypothetical protein